MSQNPTSDQEDSTLDPRQSGLVEEATLLTTKLITSEPRAKTPEIREITELTKPYLIEDKTTMPINEESTRDESQSSLLGEESLPSNEVVMKQETESTGEANTREESQDSMAEIRKILATPIVVIECNPDIDMSQQETSEREVTITEIIEEINKSSSSKSNNSTQEELENKLVINEDTLEQSTRDEFQSSLLGEALTNQQQTITTQETTTTAPNLVQNIKSSELLIPREEFELIDDPNSLEEIVIYDVVVEYQGIMTSTTHMEEDIVEIKMEPTETNTSVIMLADPSRTPRDHIAMCWNLQR